MNPHTNFANQKCGGALVAARAYSATAPQFFQYLMSSINFNKINMAKLVRGYLAFIYFLKGC